MICAAAASLSACLLLSDIGHDGKDRFVPFRRRAVHLNGPPPLSISHSCLPDMT